MRNGNEWVSRMKLRDSNGVHHAVDNRNAMLCVTRGNILRLIYQQDGQSWTETRLDLGDLIDCDDVITHAAFGDGPGEALNPIAKFGRSTFSCWISAYSLVARESSTHYL